MGFMEQSDEYYTNVIIDSLAGSKALPKIHKQMHINIIF